MSCLPHLECGMCATAFEANRLWNLCPKCQKPLRARYDPQAAPKTLDRGRIKEREKAAPFNTGSGHKYSHLWN